MTRYERLVQALKLTEQFHKPLDAKAHHYADAVFEILEEDRRETRRRTRGTCILATVVISLATGLAGLFGGYWLAYDQYTVPAQPAMIVPVTDDFHRGFAAGIEHEAWFCEVNKDPALDARLLEVDINPN